MPLYPSFSFDGPENKKVIMCDESAPILRSVFPLEMYFRMVLELAAANEPLRSITYNSTDVGQLELNVSIAPSTLNGKTDASIGRVVRGTAAYVGGCRASWERNLEELRPGLAALDLRVRVWSLPAGVVHQWTSMTSFVVHRVGSNLSRDDTHWVELGMTLGVQAFFFMPGDDGVVALTVSIITLPTRVAAVCPLGLLVLFRLAPALAGSAPMVALQAWRSITGIQPNEVEQRYNTDRGAIFEMWLLGACPTAEEGRCDYLNHVKEGCREVLPARTRNRSFRERAASGSSTVAVKQTWRDYMPARVAATVITVEVLPKPEGSELCGSGLTSWFDLQLLGSEA
ncbi:hypothetical protein BC827DRAFT_1155445 [Russula dissimulans]|nr:hypothetical protein BC827DRAFT_1155445 [Russula dissimulans]